MVVCHPRTLEGKAGRTKVLGQFEYVEELWLIKVEKEKKKIVGLLAGLYSHIT